MAVKSSRGSPARGASPKAAGRPAAKAVAKPVAANPLKTKQKTVFAPTPSPKPALSPKAAPRIPAPTPVLKLKRGGSGAIRVGIAGCAGKMGQRLLKLLVTAPGVLVVGGTERRGSHVLGRDLGALAGGEPLGITIGENPEPLFEQSDVVVDFTSPSATAMHAGLAAKTGTAHVVGTTGLDSDQMAAISRAAQRVPIVMASNMSLGVNLLEQVVEEVSRILDTDWDIEIVEMHHRHKIDAPSGTALSLGDAAARGRNVQLRRVAKRGRDGQVGPRAKGEIGFSAIRGGDVVGDHSVIFAADGERIEISHKASNREIFARGAVKAVLWAAGKRPGLYSMKDVLGFNLNASSGATGV
jgi:4-hydroxy-tetrahydrodipicolinate reductase